MTRDTWLFGHPYDAQPDDGAVGETAFKTYQEAAANYNAEFGKRALQEAA